MKEFVDAGIVLVNSEVVPVGDENLLLGVVVCGALVGLGLIVWALRMNKRDWGRYL